MYAFTLYLFVALHIVIVTAFVPLHGQAVEADVLQREIITRLSRVPEFSQLQQLAQKHKINKVYLFGGTSAAWAHYVRWSLEHENASERGVRFNAMILDYNLASIVCHNQDVDIAVDHPNADEVNQFKNELEVLNTEANRKIYELRGLHHDYGGKSALANNYDFLNQNTDSMSTTLIELYSESPKTQTEKKGYENFVASSALGETNRAIENRSSRSSQLTTPTNEQGRNYRDKFIDLRHPGSKLSGSNQFLIDVAAGHISCYYDKSKHKKTKRYQQGDNPDIFFAIRVLNKMFQYGLSLYESCYTILKSIWADFNPSKHLKTGYAQNWLNTHARKLYQNALDLEKAHLILKDLGALEKLQALEGDKYKDLVLLMHRQPLLSQPLVDEDSTELTTAVEASRPATAGELGIQYVTHYTSSARAYEAITSSPILQANVFISRQRVKGEAAVFGDGFYTSRGFITTPTPYGDGRWPVWFYVDPRARKGVDFEIHRGDILVFKNKAALYMVGDTSEYDVDFPSVQLFQSWFSRSRDQAERQKRTMLKDTLLQFTIDSEGSPGHKDRRNQDSLWDLMQSPVMQSRLWRQIIADLQKHSLKRQALNQLADSLLQQYIRDAETYSPALDSSSTFQPTKYTARTRLSLFAQNVDFWLRFFQLPVEGLEFDFLTYLRLLAQNPHIRGLSSDYHKVDKVARQKMYEHFQSWPEQRAQLIQIASQKAQQPLSFLTHQNFWRTYINLGLSLEGFDPMPYFQNLADSYLEDSHRDDSRKGNSGASVASTLMDSHEISEKWPYLHIDIETFLLQQVREHMDRMDELEKIATQLIEQRPALHQSPAFWLTYLRLRWSTRLERPVYKYLNSTYSKGDKKLVQKAWKKLLHSYPHWKAMLAQPPLPLAVEKSVIGVFEVVYFVAEKIKQITVGRVKTQKRRLKPLPVLSKEQLFELATRSKAGLEDLKMALALGLDVDDRDESRVFELNLLALMLEKDNLEGMRFLLAAGADPDSKGGYYHDESTTLMYALREQKVEAVELLIEGGADVNARDYGGETPLSYLMQIEVDENGKADRLQLVRILLDEGIDLNAASDLLGSTVLMNVAATGVMSSVQMLLGVGAFPDARDKNKRTALMKAAIVGQLASVKALLAAGANPNLRDEDGYTALMKAAIGGQLASVKALLAAGANPNLRDEDGYTALMFLPMPNRFAYQTIKKQSVKIARVLLSQGASLEPLNKYGRSAVDMARRENHTELLQVFKDHMDSQANKAMPDTESCSEILVR